jgi:hypothetical protein
LAYLLRKSKNCNKEESGKRISGLMSSGKKGVHFFGKGYCEKCTGMKQQRKRRAKKDLLQNQNANNFYQRKLC